MNYIRQASEKYDCDCDGSISPISQVDGDIITQLMSVLSLKGGNDEVVEILSDWKRDQDGHILDRMTLCSTEDAEDRETYPMLDVMGHIINLGEIQYIQPTDEWRRDRRVYLLMINPEEFVHAKTLTKNIELKFYNEEDRDNCRNRMKVELEKSKNIEFIKIN